MRQRREELQRRKAQLEAFKPKSMPRGSVTAGIGGVTGHEFATTVQSVLHAWRFPGLPTVSFDDKTHDILIDGKSRRANAKGVRALMNAAFKIGVLLYCRQKELPHPGIVVLDSPLLSYRDPLTSRHGELDADEKEVKDSGLKEHFYKFLVDQNDQAQFIISASMLPPFTADRDQGKPRIFFQRGSTGSIQASPFADSLRADKQRHHRLFPEFDWRRIILDITMVVAE